LINNLDFSLTDRANVLRDLVLVILQCADPALALAGAFAVSGANIDQRTYCDDRLGQSRARNGKGRVRNGKAALAMANVVFAMATVALIRQGLAISAGEVVTIPEHEALADDAFASHNQI